MTKVHVTRHRRKIPKQSTMVRAYDRVIGEKRKKRKKSPVFA